HRAEVLRFHVQVAQSISAVGSFFSACCPRRVDALPRLGKGDSRELSSRQPPLRVASLCTFRRESWPSGVARLCLGTYRVRWRHLPDSRSLHAILCRACRRQYAGSHLRVHHPPRLRRLRTAARYAGDHVDGAVQRPRESCPGSSNGTCMIEVPPPPPKMQNLLFKRLSHPVCS